MESLWLLLPLSVLIVLGLIALIAWSVGTGQFDDLDREGVRILETDRAADATVAPLDGGQGPSPARAEEFPQALPDGGPGRAATGVPGAAATTNPDRS